MPRSARDGTARQDAAARPGRGPAGLGHRRPTRRHARPRARAQARRARLRARSARHREPGDPLRRRGQPARRPPRRHAAGRRGHGSEHGRARGRVLLASGAVHPGGHDEPGGGGAATPAPRPVRPVRRRDRACANPRHVWRSSADGAASRKTRARSRVRGPSASRSSRRSSRQRGLRLPGTSHLRRGAVRDREPRADRRRRRPPRRPGHGARGSRARRHRRTTRGFPG